MAATQFEIDMGFVAHRVQMGLQVDRHVDLTSKIARHQHTRGPKKSDPSFEAACKMQLKLHLGHIQ